MASDKDETASKPTKTRLRFLTTGVVACPECMKASGTISITADTKEAVFRRKRLCISKTHAFCTLQNMGDPTEYLVGDVLDLEELFNKEC